MERVLSSGVLRCGYFEEAPFTIIDPSTGKRSGIAVEVAEKIATELNLKLEWTAAVNFALLAEDLQNGRYDAICASVFNLPRAGKTDYTLPYAYVPVYGYTQKNRTDFDNKLGSLDWSKITVAGLDGEGATTIMHKKQPDAKFNTLPQSSSIAEMLTSVADKKADMAFVMPTVFKDFEVNNPNLLRKIETNAPMHVFSVSFALKPDETAFRNMLDTTIRNMIVSGDLQATFNKYDPNGLLMQPNRPF